MYLHLYISTYTILHLCALISLTLYILYYYIKSQVCTVWSSKDHSVRLVRSRIVIVSCSFLSINLYIFIISFSYNCIRFTRRMICTVNLFLSANDRQCPLVSQKMCPPMSHYPIEPLSPSSKRQAPPVISLPQIIYYIIALKVLI